jgi:uncharacterized protein YaaW (UPF0174 family)
MWNPFKKTNNQNNNNGLQNNNDANTDKKDSAQTDSLKMNMLQRLAMKKMEKMSAQEKAKLMQEVFKPENKSSLLSAMEMMRKSGQISEEQYQAAKQKLEV